MWLIIGYGNSLRGDDGSGPHLVKRLRQRLPESLAQYIVSHQLLPEMVEDMVQPTVTKVLFIDAQRDQRQPVVLTPLRHKDCESSTTHNFGPEALLDLADKLYQQPRPGWLLSLRGSEFNHSERFSSDTHIALEKAYLLVEKLLVPPCHSKIKR